MLGKLINFINYWKALEVYIIKRFPSNKIPVFGTVATYLGLYYLFNRWELTRRTQILRQMRENSECKSWNWGYSNKRNQNFEGRRINY